MTLFQIPHAPIPQRDPPDHGPGSYRGFSKWFRNAIGSWQNAEFRAGRLERPTQCLACWQSGGEIIAHLEDYERPLDIDPLCVRCHLVLHSRRRNPGAWERYRAAIRAGAIFPPLTHRKAFGNIGRFLRALELKDRLLLSEHDAGFTYGPPRGPTYLDTLLD